MSDKNWSTTQTSIRLEKVELLQKIPLILSDEIVDKIKYTCKCISKVEWSGILFYGVIGSIKDIANMQIQIKDILLMDKGTQAYTEYNWDEEVVEYRMNNPESLDWLAGHIHSHNSMSVFFSGTDMSELNDNCPNHNFYLSLIVNNYMEMTAKIAFTAQPTIFICKDENGKNYTMELSVRTNPLMLIYDCNIQSSIPQITVDETYIQRLKVIEEKSIIAAEVERTKVAMMSAPTSKILEPIYNSRNLNATPGLFSEGLLPFELAEMQDKDTPIEHITVEEQFVAFILRMGNYIESDDLVNALEDIEISKISGISLAGTIITSYVAYYEQFFDKMPQYSGEESFNSVLQIVIDILEEEKEWFIDTIKPVVNSLKSLQAKIRNDKGVIINKNKQKTHGSKI